MWFLVLWFRRFCDLFLSLIKMEYLSMQTNTCREQSNGEREWERVYDRDFISFKNETTFYNFD